MSVVAELPANRGTYTAYFPDFSPRWLGGSTRAFRWFRLRICSLAKPLFGVSTNIAKKPASFRDPSSRFAQRSSRIEGASRC